MQPAGLLDGPLEQQAQRGDLRWIGDPSVAAEVTIEIVTSSRDSASGATVPSFSATYDSVLLHAGYG